MDSRVPPQALEAESNVIGSMIIDSSIVLDIIDVLDKEDFYDLRHKVIYDAICELYKANETIDIISLSEKLKKAESLDNIGGFDALIALVDSVVTTANALAHAKIVKEKSQRRKIIKAAHNIENMAYSHDDIEDIIESSEKDILSVNQLKSISYSNLSNEISNSLNQLEIRCQNKGQISGLSTGFITLDYKLGGLQDRDLIIIAARPSMGKTSLAIEIALNVACKKIPVAFFSLEMSKEKITNRIISSWNFIDNKKIRLGTLDENDWNTIAGSITTLTNTKFVIDDTPNIKAIEIKSKCRRIKNEMGGLGLIVVDHLTEMWRPHKKGTDASEHEENVRCMKRLAKEMNCPVILLQQLNRGVEGRNDKRPQLSDLKETGAAEEVADVVMMIYRDDYYNPESEKKNIAEIIIQKGRDIGTGTVELAWLGQYTKFANLERVRG